MSYEDFIASLSPTVAKIIKTAQESEIERLPLASYGLTKALGGGIAKGRIALIYGNQSSGKSLMALQSIAEYQRRGLICAYVDVEGTYDKVFAAKLGVDNERLILIRSKSSGKIEERIKPLLLNKIDCIVVDSISDIMPENFIGKDGDLNNQEDRKQIGAQAKAITALLNGIHYFNEDTAVILLSQTTTSINATYVEQVPHGGQKALFASSQIIKLNSSQSEGQQLKGDIHVGGMILEQPIGRKVEWLIKKNKLGDSFGRGDYNMYYKGPTIGIDVMGEIVAEAIKYGLVKKAGVAWFKYNDSSYSGKTGIDKFFKDNPEELELLKKKILEMESQIV